MATATISREYSALPWYGATVVIFEFTVDPSSNTIETATRGFTSVRILIAADNTGVVNAAGVAGKATVTANGTLVTIASGSSAVVTLIVIGR